MKREKINYPVCNKAANRKCFSEPLVEAVRGWCYDCNVDLREGRSEGSSWAVLCPLHCHLHSGMGSLMGERVTGLEHHFPCTFCLHCGCNISALKAYPESARKSFGRLRDLLGSAALGIHLSRHSSTSWLASTDCIYRHALPLLAERLCCRNAAVSALTLCTGVTISACKFTPALQTNMLLPRQSQVSGRSSSP